MGQTLTHGIYLPDEGERNCYNGLAGNWSLLDGAVGTIAEHTTQIAGKAASNHVHGNITNDGKVGTAANKPLITGTGGVVQAGSFGISANTFCEGNDSRLSDARTPVAHTHTKSDVTDLFNSANTWTGSNQYNVSVKFNGQTGINWARGGTTGTIPASVMYYGFQNALDSNDNVFDRIRSYVSTTGTNLQEHIKYAWNDLTKYATINFWINADGSDSEYKLSVKRVIPNRSNETDLGTSTIKWKSLNGINPGALSFPEGTTSNANTTFNPDLTDWLTDGTGFTITAQVTGWLHIRIKNSTGNFAWVKRATAGTNQTWGIVGNSDTNSDIVDIPLNVPVVQGYVYTLKLKTSPSALYAAIFMCLGNV